MVVWLRGASKHREAPQAGPSPGPVGAERVGWSGQLRRAAPRRRRAGRKKGAVRARGTPGHLDILCKSQNFLLERRGAEEWCGQSLVQQEEELD